MNFEPLNVGSPPSHVKRQRRKCAGITHPVQATKVALHQADTSKTPAFGAALSQPKDGKNQVTKTITGKKVAMQHALYKVFSRGKDKAFIRVAQ